MNKPRIAFLGLGIMGSGMARRLLVHGFPLTVFNRDAKKTAAFAAEGAQVAGSPREAATQAGMIVTMVADDIASRALWLGENGALAGSKPGLICLECSTVTVNWTRELAAAVVAKQCDFLDAPLTGSKAHAAAGELTFLAGGESATLEKARPALAVMGKTIHHIGPAGSGALLKLINNFVCGVQVASFAEALAMIERSGLDRAKALEVLTAGAPGSPLVKTVAARMSAPDFTPNFPLRLMTKDLGYAIQEGNNNAVELKTAAAALEDFRSAIAKGHGDQDMAAVIEPMRKK
jgi:3-hydroxyisobutyrate dehydrogenase